MTDTSASRRNSERPTSVAADFLHVEISERIFAIALEAASLVIPYVTPEPLSTSCRGCSGFVRHQGEIIPILDLMCHLEGGSTRIERQSCICVLKIETQGQCQCLGLLVSTVHDIRRVTPTAIKDMPQGSASAACLHRVIASERALIPILEPALLLNSVELKTCADAAAKLVLSPSEGPA